MTTAKQAGAFALAMILAAIVIEPADAKSRRKPKRTSALTIVIEQNAVIMRQNVKVMKQNAVLKHELAKIERLFQTSKVASVPWPVPAMPVNPAIAAIIPIPDVREMPDPGSKTLQNYKREILAPLALPSRHSLGNIRGLKKPFVTRLVSMHAAMPPRIRFSVGSGCRSRAEQARLYALKPGLAARPGRSNHEKCLAADLRYPSSESRRWAHRNARKFGLRFPMSYEAWHIEPVGLTKTRYAKKRVRHASVS